MGLLRRTARRHAGWLACVCLAVAACGSANPLGRAPTGPNSVIVGSADFPESKILAEIYAQALQHNGFDVTRQLGIGSREAYVPALHDHSIDLVPEYVGDLLLYIDPQATATTLGDIVHDLSRRLPPDLAVLSPSPAADTDTVTVASSTAVAWRLSTIGDLAPHSAQVRFAAPSDFASRPSGFRGLRQRYGLDVTPGNFVAISDGGGAVTVRTLEQGKVNAANIFSTSPALLRGNLVALADPRHNFPAGNVVPLVSAQKRSPRLVSTLNRVSSALTSRDLAGLNASVAGNGGLDPDEAARRWLREHHLDSAVES